MFSVFSLSKRRLGSDLIATYKYLHREKIPAIERVSNLAGKNRRGVAGWQLKLDRSVLQMKHEFQQGKQPLAWDMDVSSPAILKSRLNTRLKERCFHQTQVSSCHYSSNGIGIWKTCGAQKVRLLDQTVIPFSLKIGRPRNCICVHLVKWAML